MLTTLLASSFAGIVLSLAMTPFDAVLTKLYKQGEQYKQTTFLFLYLYSSLFLLLSVSFDFPSHLM